jgi:plasmid stability protein
MAQIIVRKVEEEVKAKLRKRAQRHGRSMEEEVREILRDATKNDGPRRKLGEEARALFAKAGLKRGEEIQELRDITLQIPNFEE